MKKVVLSILFTISIITANAQTTAIPDANFEQALIDLWIDSGPIDGSVPTANINTVSSLNLSAYGISDLTGIEDFTMLSYLDCGNNQLTSINLSQNTSLTYVNCMYNQLTTIDVTQNVNLYHLVCIVNQLTSLDVSQNPVLYQLESGYNQLTTLDVTQNPALVALTCHDNQLTTLDVTQNPALTSLFCGYNQLTTLDVSQNTALHQLDFYYNQLSTIDLSQHTVLSFLDCSNNQLTCLNVKNTNNMNFSFYDARNNPALTCIEVDDVAYSTANWTSIDPTSSFSTNCNNACSTIGVGVAGKTGNNHNLNIYPNPTSGQITISLEEAKTGVLRVLNSLNQVILEDKFKGARELNTYIDEPSGIYFLQIEINGEVITKKIVKE
tara:strand:- start:37 stop:1179 length:1143 start_codon:yes stop_codon:yes gene_type:complete